MNGLEAGTMTFLFTDIEGSTRRWEQHTAAMQAALERHDALLREAIEGHGGRVFKTVGDAFCAAFASAGDALAAAVASQRAVQAEAWAAFGPEFPPIRVRIGLHTGAAQEREGDYFGPPVNRAARIEAAGHGGQTLISAATWERVRDDLPDGVALRDLGERRLKDLRRPERLYQVLARDLPADFPPLATLDARPNNLPVQLTSFVGREREVGEVKRLLSKSHLVTLIGIGGTGKTRLSLQAAADMIDDFDHGVWFVDLAPLTDPALIASTVASVLGVKDEPGRPIEAMLADKLKSKRLLVILDNCEHVVAACAELAEQVLRAAPGVRILATSREALAIAGEAALAIPPLAVPEPAIVADAGVDAAAVLTQYDAVRLFVDRAAAARADFAVTNVSAPAVAGICHRLDGIPLAIELAAARVRTLTAEEIHARLADRFRLLTGGSRTAAARQRTLAAAIDWSHDLLDASEQAVLRRLAVFRGGWTMDAAEAVCGGDGVEAGEVLDVMARLVDKSLIVAGEAGSGMRYRFLETVREYAWGKLDEVGESSASADRHFTWCASFAETDDPLLNSADALEWMARVEVEIDNIRSALDWGLATNDLAMSERGVRLALAVVELVGRCTGVREAVRLSELAFAALAARQQPVLAARCTFLCGCWQAQAGSIEGARARFEQAIPMFAAMGEDRELAWATQNLGDILGHHYGEIEQARRLIRESIDLRRRSAPGWDVAIGINNLGELERSQGNISAAMAAYEEAIALNAESEHGDDKNILPRHNLGMVTLRHGVAEAARPHFERALRMARMHRIRPLSASCLAGLAGVAGVAAVGGLGVQAARLFGAADAYLDAWGYSGHSATDQRDHDHHEAIALALLSDAEWRTAYAEGRAIEADDAVAYALGERDPWAERSESP